jgi:hypothetical protein
MNYGVVWVCCVAMNWNRMITAFNRPGNQSGELSDSKQNWCKVIGSKEAVKGCAVHNNEAPG